MNSQLHHKFDVQPIAIPREILNVINAKLMTSNPQTPGYQRGKDLLKNRTLNYGTLKRLKNFFDYCDPNVQRDQFELAGGQGMRHFVEKTLQSSREETKLQNKNKSVSMPPGAMDNTLNAGDGSVKMDLAESEVAGKKPRGALAVIVNEENKVLIVKRTPFKGSWMPNRLALIGGGIEEGEEPIDAAKREAMEESGLKLEHFVDSFNIVSPPDTVDYVFVAKAPKNQEVKLNEEHTSYKWASLEEIGKIPDECVPMLYECVELALSKIEKRKLNEGRDFIDWNKNYGKSFRLALTPKDATDNYENGLISVVTPENGKSWYDWPNVDQNTLNGWKMNWNNIQKTLGDHKYNQIIKHIIR